MPTSGLNDQRLVPRLINFAESYCPSGGTTTRLMPTIVCWRYDANAFGVIDGAPYRFIASRSLGSPGPKRSTSAGSPRYRPCTWPTITGTETPALAERPARLNARVKENAVVLMVALASWMGAD